MIRLIPYDAQYLDNLIEWVKTEEEMHRWAATSFLFPLTQKQFYDYPGRFTSRAYWLISEDRVIGLGDIVSDTEKKELRLARIIIDPKQRGLGYGKELTRLIVREALRQLPSSSWAISLWVLADNPVAQKVYQSIGFILQEEKASFSAGDKEYLCHKMIWNYEES